MHASASTEGRQRGFALRAFCLSHFTIQGALASLNHSSHTTLPIGSAGKFSLACSHIGLFFAVTGTGIAESSCSLRLNPENPALHTSHSSSRNWSNFKVMEVYKKLKTLDQKSADEFFRDNVPHM